MKSSLKLNSNLAELVQLNSHIQALQNSWSLPPKTGIEVNLILDELITNIIEHSSPEPQEIIEIELIKSGNELTIEVMNSGPAFDPTKCKGADTTLPLEKRVCGGLGIHLVKQLSDSCSYTRSHGKNIFSFKKHIPQENR
jgi:serine/threonine-protein kinase RsbW